ncbi:uncharacterized protein LOC131680727 [Topomyia yanbarensis]|uniref:uncharacterized protein LOC131680727 n=1 Tax=Topomyia yanbarensis TaxID=2498891 RepID=UPI00273A9B68|nr:uncharacterized protein LOC131680727 [Topomyia yanbarensis]
MDDYMLAVADHCYDIITLTGTWLDCRAFSSQIFGPEYEVFRCDRNPCNSKKLSGGGVAIAVHKQLKARVVEDDAWKCIEQIWVAIELGDRTLFLCAVYFPPDRIRDSMLIDAHIQSISHVMTRMTPVDEIAILGDFNLPGLSWQPSHSGFLYPDTDNSVFHASSINLLDSYSTVTLFQINDVVNENGRSLDLCFVSAQDVAPTIYAAPAPLVKVVPQHRPLVVVMNRKRPRVAEIIPDPVFYDYRNADHRSIEVFLAEFDWDGILDSNDVEQAAQTSTHVMAYIIDRFIPKKVNRNGVHPPWQSPELRRLKTVKRAALRKFTKYRTMPLRNYYVKLNMEYKNVSKRCYSHHKRNVQRKFKSNPNSFWKYINEQRKESGLPSTTTLNGEMGTDNNEICRLH